MSLEVHETLDECNVKVDPDKIQLPAMLALTLSDDGAVHLGDAMIVSPCDDGQAQFEKIKQAFQEGRYALKISSYGRIEFEMH